MKISAPLGLLLVSLMTLTASAQVVGGYSSLVPTQLSSAPVFDNTPLFNTPGKSVRVQMVSATLPAASQNESDRAARAAAIRDVDQLDETHSVLKKSGARGDVVFANYQAPATFNPVEEKLAPIPVAMTNGGAPYYQPTYGAQVIPVQASAPVPMTQNACCNPCVTCCMPISQVATVAQPSVIQQPITVATAPSQLPPNMVFGRGIVFQPVVYVEGQPVRNFLRFISP